MKKIPLVLAGAAAAVVPVIVMAPKPEPALPEGPAGKPLRTVADVVTVEQIGDLARFDECALDRDCDR